MDAQQLFLEHSLATLSQQTDQKAEATRKTENVRDLRSCERYQIRPDAVLQLCWFELNPRVNNEHCMIFVFTLTIYKEGWSLTVQTRLTFPLQTDRTTQGPGPRLRERHRFISWSHSLMATPSLELLQIDKIHHLVTKRKLIKLYWQSLEEKRPESLKVATLGSHPSKHSKKPALATPPYPAPAAVI